VCARNYVEHVEAGRIDRDDQAMLEAAGRRGTCTRADVGRLIEGGSTRSSGPADRG